MLARCYPVGPTTVPAHGFYDKAILVQDLRAELMHDQDAYFTGGYSYQEVPGAGHFLHREQSAAVKQLLLDWLRQGLSRFRQRHGKMVFHFAA